MKSILEVEYTKYSSRVRMSRRSKVKRAIMAENSSRFKLIYSSSIFQNKVLSQIGYIGDLTSSLNLIYNNQLLNL